MNQGVENLPGKYLFNSDVIANCLLNLRQRHIIGQNEFETKQTNIHTDKKEESNVIQLNK